jgi:LCP family protein required for cell wall assembly
VRERQRAHSAANGSRLASFHAWRDRRHERLSARSVSRRRLTRTGIGLALVLVIVLGGSGIFLEVELHKITHIAVHVTPTAAGADDIMLVGSTDRCAVGPAKNLNNFVQQCQHGVNGINSDVIMVLRLVPGRTPTLLSLPRDTFVPDARAGGLYNKVDAALANGPSQLVKAVEEDFGVPINHYVVLNFESFTKIADALGGITMYFPYSMKDVQSGLYISHSGCLHISGLEALALVRARHLQYDYDPKTKSWLGYDGSGDIGRIERVHLFLKALAAQVAAKGIGNVSTDAKLLSSVAPYLTVDQTLSTGTMLSIVKDYHSNIGSALQLTLPVIEDTSTYYYKGYNYGDVVFPAAPEDQQTLDRFMGGRPLGATVRPGSVTVSVVDAAASSTAKANAMTELRALGYKVIDGGSVTPVGPISETTVRYATSATLAKATRVLRSLNGAVVLGRGPVTPGASVTIYLGSDVGVDAPAASTVSAGPSSTSLVGELIAATASSLAAPTTATSAIPKYDPRSCPKG